MRTLLVLAAAVPFFSTPADACTCRVPGPPCESMFSSTVFVGTALKTDGSTDIGGVTTFDVSETLHSNTPLGKTVEVHHLLVSSMCGLFFAPGTTYVVYADEVKGVLQAGACSRTHRLTEPDDDVTFARSSPTRAKTLVEGKLVRAEGHEKAPFKGAEVIAVDAGVSAKVSSTGAFALELPAGRYTLDIASPNLEHFVAERPVKLELDHAAACPKPVIMVSWNGKVRGKVTRAGAPVAGLEVLAIAPRERDRHWRLSAKTRADGTYEITGVEPGEYWVAVSPPEFGGPSPKSPYPPTWAPKTKDLSHAMVVKIGPAGSAVADLELPAPLPTHALKVVVTDATGAPAKGAHVSISPASGKRTAGGSADDQGTLTLDEIGGVELVVRACTHALKNCVDARRTLTGATTVELKLK